jgi:hypothetical protein
VVPASQKFGYQNSYDISIELAYRICGFIETYRAQIVESTGVSSDVAQDRIFLSSTTGRPLANNTISRIFGDAFRAIGAPPGAGLHSFRRTFAVDQIERSIGRRARYGLDTSAESIAADVAIEMGQLNPESLVPYVSRAQSRIAVGHTTRERSMEERGVEYAELRRRIGEGL